MLQLPSSPRLSTLRLRMVLIFKSQSVVVRNLRNQPQHEHYGAASEVIQPNTATPRQQHWLQEQQDARRIDRRRMAETDQVARIIDGKAIAEQIRAALKTDVARLTAAGFQPSLAIIRVGDRKDSMTYVNMKKKACEEAGIKLSLTEVPASITEAELLELVAKENSDPTIFGILVQLPLPSHIDEKRILDSISLDKDVDGFHPMNIGCLGMKGRAPEFVPGTPKAFWSFVVN